MSGDEKRRLVDDQKAVERPPSSPVKNVTTLEELQQGHGRKVRAFAWRALLYVLAYLIVGTLVFMSDGMGFLDALLYSIVITTTVGYGAEVEDKYVKLFIVCFLVVDMCLIANLLAFLVGAFLDAQEQVLATVLEVRRRGGTEVDVQAPKSGPKIRRSILTLLGIIFVGVIVFAFVDGLGWIDSLYMVAVTVTTTGLGDLVPATTFTKVFSIFYLPIATLGLGKVLGDYADLQTQARAEKMEESILNCRIDNKRFFDMDSDHDGKVDKLEFLIGTLIAQGKIDREDADTVLRRFYELDVDNSGSITLEEVGIETA